MKGASSRASSVTDPSKIKTGMAENTQPLDVYKRQEHPWSRKRKTRVVYRQPKNLKGDKKMNLKKTDPEFAERFEHFAFDEVVNEENQQLEPPTDVYKRQVFSIPI